MRNVIRFFQGLRGRLILTYTLTTVLALLALELIFLGGLFVVWLFNNNDRDQYLLDVQNVLAPRAANYLIPGSEDLEGLQAWLDEVHRTGYGSLPAQFTMDAPAAPLSAYETIYIIAPDQTILAYAPLQSGELLGKPYSAPEPYFEQVTLQMALDGQVSTRFSTKTQRGEFRLALPVLPWASPPPGWTGSVPAPSSDPRVPLAAAPSNLTPGTETSWEPVRTSDPAAVIIVTVEPPPPLYTLWPTVMTGLGILALTGLGLLMAVTPFGALFGLIMSRSLTRRLGELTRAAEAWSEGNFSVVPKDRGRDEIGLLSQRMRQMAERTQNLLQSQQELGLLEERNRLARDLHDTVKQQNFATLMQLRAAKNRLETEPAEALEAIEQAEGLVKAAQQDLGMIIAELRPAMLEGQGLAGALRAYLQTWSQHSRIPFEMEVEGERLLPLNLEQALYRVAQEALSNAARHSAASKVELRLAYLPERVLLVIRDNGLGFDPAQPGLHGFGLDSMQQRLAALGGSFEVRSRPGQGAAVFASLPLNPGIPA